MNKVLQKYKNMPITAKAALWFIICSMLQKCVSVITVPIFTRIMSPNEYGIFNTYLSWYSIISVFCTLNMHNCIYMNSLTKLETDDEKNESAISMLSLSQLITFILFIIYICFHSIFNKIIGLPTALVCLLFIEVLFEPAINFWRVKQRFTYKYVKLVLITVFMVLINAVFGIVFVLFFNKYAALARVISVVLVELFFGSILYISYYRCGKSVFKIKNWKHYLDVQIPLLPHGLSLTILSSSDRIMINQLTEPINTAIYSVAYSAGYIVNVLKNSVMDALRPWIYSKIKNKDFDKIREMSNSILILIIAITIIFIAFAPEVITIMAPGKYYEAIYVIPPVAASSFFTFLYNMFSSVGFYYEKTKRIMIASISGAILNIVLNFIFIPIFGYIAAGYTTLFCYMFFAFAHYLIMKSICKKKLDGVEIFDIKYITLLSICVLAMTVLFSIIYNFILVRYIIIVIVVTCIIMMRNRIKKLFKIIKVRS